MRKYMFPLLLMFLSVCGLAQRQPEKIRQDIRQAMHIQEEAWNRGDIPGFMDYYWNNDSLKFIGSRGITYGWQPTLNNYKKSYPDQTAMGVLTFDITTIEVLSDTAVFVIGKWHLKKEKEAGGYYTLLWKKIAGKWVIVVDHTS